MEQAAEEGRSRPAKAGIQRATHQSLAPIYHSGLLLDSGLRRNDMRGGGWDDGGAIGMAAHFVRSSSSFQRRLESRKTGRDSEWITGFIGCALDGHPLNCHARLLAGRHVLSNPLDSGLCRNDGEGNRNVLIVPLAIATQKRDACLLVVGTSDNNLNIQGSDE